MFRGRLWKAVTITRQVHTAQRVPRTSIKLKRPDPKSSTLQAPPIPSRPHSTKSRIYKWTRRLVMGFLGYHVITDYFFSFAPTQGISMLPTISSYGDWVLISKYYRKGRDVGVGDIVSYKIPTRQPLAMGIKRVIGMPGDFVLRDTPGKSDIMIQVPEGHCWLAGDNMTWARDSRMFGPLPLALIQGKVLAKVETKFPPWPQMMKHGLQPSVEEDLD